MLIFLLAATDVLPKPDSTEGKVLTILAAVAVLAQGWMNQRATKTVGNKTDNQTELFAGLFEDMRTDMKALQEAQTINDKLTTEELADHAGQLMTLASAHGQLQAAQEHQGRLLNEHGAQIVTLADGLARVQTAVNLRATDRAMAGGLVSALTPQPAQTGPNGESE